MAKVTYSALVDTIRGKLNGSIASQWKGINVLKSHPTPRQPRTESQQLVRGLMNNHAGDWYGLSSTLKDLWNRYASLLSKPMTGLNAYIKQNSNLDRYLGSGSAISNPPPTPSTPEAISGLSIAVTDSLNNTITWASPTGSSDYIIADYSFMAGLDDGSNPRWSFAGGDYADQANIVHNHAFPVGTVMRYRARVMDSYGRVSPNTSVTTVTVA